MDIGDMLESTRAKEAKRSPRQLKYLNGGRRNDFRTDRSFPTSMDLQERVVRHDGGSGRSPRNADRYARVKQSSFATPASDRPNRAARRAAIFGLGDTLPGRLRVSKNESNQNRLNSSDQSEGHTKTSWRAASTRDESFGETKKTFRNHVDWQNEESERSILRTDLGTGNANRRSYPRTPIDNGPPENSWSNRSRARSSSRDKIRTASGDHGPYTPRYRDEARSDASLEPPLTVPYTTPASEFLYGTSVVHAALRYSHRRLYKLYIYSAPERGNTSQDTSLRKLAESKGVEVAQVKGEWLRMLDKMSTGRPHNGYILEASPLPRLPVTRLKFVERPLDGFVANLEHQSREDEAINGAEGKIEFSSPFARYPFVLMLDGIIDPGNLGALLRTAYFFGVDAVAISTRNCAPLSPVTLKASAGASESLRILSVFSPERFITESQANGWKCYAAVAPDVNAKVNKGRPYHSTSTLQCPAIEHPTILMLGGEGEGLRPNLRKRADFVVGIEGNRLGTGGVDSLNVSVAAGVLCEAFLRKPLSRTSTSPKGDADTVEQAENSLF